MQPKLITNVPLTAKDLQKNAATSICINVGGMLLQIYTTSIKLETS